MPEKVLPEDTNMVVQAQRPQKGIKVRLEPRQEAALLMLRPKRNMGFL